MSSSSLEEEEEEEEDSIVSRDPKNRSVRRPPETRRPNAWLQRTPMGRIQSWEEDGKKKSLWQRFKNALNLSSNSTKNRPLPQSTASKAWDHQLDQVLVCGGITDGHAKKKEEKVKVEPNSTFYKKYNKFASKKVISNLEFPTQKEVKRNDESDDEEFFYDQKEEEKDTYIDQPWSKDEPTMISQVYMPKLPEGDTFRRPKPISKKHVTTLEEFPRENPWIWERPTVHYYWGVNDFSFNYASVETEK